MSQGKSIFSNPTSTNGEAPVNPFASLANGKAPNASPFAAAAPAEAASPFGFADEEPSSTPQARLPEKRQPESERVPVLGVNPFSAAPEQSAPQAEATPVQEPTPTPAQQTAPQSPFAPSVGFEAPAAPTSEFPAQQSAASVNPLSSASANPLANPLSAQAPEAAAPVREEVVARAPQEAPTPQAQPEAQPQPQPQAAAQAAPVAAASAPSPSASAPRQGSTRQLELRAIFGVEGEMTREEMLQRAKSLPGIRGVSVVGASEMAAVQTIGDVMSRFGYGESGSWQMTCSGGVVDFVVSEGTTLAVMREGRYGAGVWEKLMILAREMGRLG